MELCGGRNVFAQVKFPAPEVSWEAVVAANPEVIIADATNKDWKERWQAFREVKAVKEGLLFTVPPDWISRAGPRLLNGVESICHDLTLARNKLK